MKSAQIPAYLTAFVAKMEREGISPGVIDSFAYYYKKIMAGENGLIFDRDISCLLNNEVEDADNLKDFSAAGKRARRQTIQIKLNGGLGTSMGLSGPKSLLKVKPENTFLEIILRQAEQSGVKLALMNSFNTHRDTTAFLSKIKPPGYPLLFLQDRFPKIMQKNLKPAVWTKNPKLEWNPPGHGNVYTALLTSGLLGTLLDGGIIYAFISNTDNLGATLDDSILGFFAEKRSPFMLEVVPKPASLEKGGHLARHKNGRLILREVAQCPQEERESFKEPGGYRFFNTNNIWINLRSLNDLIDRQKTIRLPMILNPKPLDPLDTGSPPAYQLETAMGAAVSFFEAAKVLCVPPSRYFPIKTCNDLLALRSDRTVVSNGSRLTLNPNCVSDTLKIELDPEYYGRIDRFEERFKNGYPSLAACESLTVQGDVRFEGEVKIKGRVAIINSRASQAVIKKGTLIDTDLIL